MPMTHPVKLTQRSPDPWLLTGLLTLALVPFVAGVSRVLGLASGAGITPDNARFFASPAPVVIHIVGATLFSILGAFQLAPGFRRRNLRWHRMAGRLVFVAGLATGLSGLWMTAFYPLPPPLQGPLLFGFRMAFGSAMVGSLVLGLAAIWRKDVVRHQAWMIRAYALGMAAGTQVFTNLPWLVLFGAPEGLTRDWLMGAGWMINLVVAEVVIRRPGRGHWKSSNPISR